MAFIRRDYPEWSWSHSRNQTFQSCHRKYYYQYYGSHNGWENQASPESALAYRLKKLTNLYLTLGDALHEAAEGICKDLQQGRPVVTEDVVLKFARNKLNHVYRQSRSGLASFKQAPNRVPMLHEFYYDKGPSQDLIDRIKNRLELCVANLIASKTLQELSQANVEILQAEQFDTFQISDTKIFAVPDLLYRTANNEWVIVDWKTGAFSEDNEDQVRLYALYVTKKYGVALEKLTARLEYLETGETREFQFGQDELVQMEQEARASMKEMYQYLLDVQKNQPLPKESFPLNVDRLCFMCNFYELCQPEIEKSLAPQAQ